MIQTTYNVKELNKIHEQWMALDPEAAEPEKQRVFSLVKKYPNKYLFINKDKTLASVIQAGCALTANMELSRAIAYAKENKIQLEVAWNGDRWIPKEQFLL